jgi:NADP-dependent 3-hydroxy acid dehydrogenase YdfG
MDAQGRRVVVVTGAARGIGRAISLALAGLGDHVLVTDIDEIGAHGTARAAQSLAGTATSRRLDVRHRADFEALIDRTEDQIGPVDALVNNAGIMPIGAFEELHEDLERAQFDINVHGVLNGLHAVLPRMRERGCGHVVNMASLAGRVPLPHGAVYAAAKFSVVGLTESLRHEYVDTGVHFSTVHPMLVRTELISGIPLPRWPAPVEPQEVAAAVVKTLRRPKALVYVPSIGRAFAVLPWILPDRIGVRLAKALGGWEIFAQVNARQREEYRNRNKAL